MNLLIGKEPFWLSVARTHIGITERVGTGSNPVILQWARDIKAPAWYTDDDQAWCALYMNRLMLGCQLPMSGEGFDLIRAHSFEKWGQKLEAPCLGAIVVFTRPGGSHVGIYLGESELNYNILGANQRNSVSVAWLPKVRATAFRWPAGVELPANTKVLLNDAGSVVSGDER